MSEESRPPFPPFTRETALKKVQAAEDAWNTRDPEKVAGQWWRSQGNEHWEFDERGLMARRYASINDLPIRASERPFHRDRSAPRPPDHPGLTELGL